MSDHDHLDDETVLDRLRAAANANDPVPEALRLAARSKLAYRRLDAALAELAFDSLDAPEPVGVRGGMDAARRLTFEAGTTQVEVEIVPEGERRRLVGQCLPATEVAVVVRRQEDDKPGTDEDEHTVGTDDLGRFSTTVPAGTISLRCVWVHTDLVVETAWMSV